MRTKSEKLQFLIIFTLLTLVLSGCQKEFSNRPVPTRTQVKTLTPTPQVTATPTVTPYPTSTPTPEPLGSPANPIIIAYIQAETNAGTEDAKNQLVQQLNSDTGLSFGFRDYMSYEELKGALLTRQVHMAWLLPTQYILASKNYQFEARLVTYHFGVKAYGIQILTNVDSAFTSYFDPTTNRSTANLNTALAQFSGTRPCFVQPKSLAGNIIPQGLFIQASVPLEKPVITYSTSSNIRALYIKGICDFTATYAISGDPRTATDLTSEFPDIEEKVEIIWRSDPIIPNLVLAYTAELDLNKSTLIDESLMTLARTENGQAILSNANNYQIEALDQIKDSEFDYLRYIIFIQDINLERLENAE